MAAFFDMTGIFGYEMALPAGYGCPDGSLSCRV